MPAQEADPKTVEALLRSTQTSDDVRYRAWEAFYSSTGPTEFAAYFDSAPLPIGLKHTLWELKFGTSTAVAPEKGARLPAFRGFREPLAEFATAVPPARPGAGGGERFALGLARGGARGVSSLTTPENIGLMAGMHTAPALLGTAGRMIAGGAGLYFTFEMARALVSSVPEAAKAFQEGDWDRLGEIIGEDAVTALLLGHGAKETRGRIAEARPPEGLPGPVKPLAAEVPLTGDLAPPAETGRPRPRPMDVTSEGYRRSIATRLGLDYDSMLPEQRARLPEIQRQMNFAALSNAATAPPTWWPPPAITRPAGRLAPVPEVERAAALPPIPGETWQEAQVRRRREQPVPGAEAPPLPIAAVMEATQARGMVPSGPGPLVRPVATEAAPSTLETAGEPASGRAGEVMYMPTSQIVADPARFQFKVHGIGEKGAGEELREVKVWNPDLAGVLSVWRDPADGKVYVVNGHHRLELAQRLNVAEVPVRFIKAANGTEARGRGALINIAEGRGTAIDAAKAFRDLEIGPEELERRGVSLKGPVSKDAIALTGLPGDIFEKVWSEQIPARRAAILGEMLRGRPEDQRAVLEIVSGAENRGKRPTDEQIREMIRLQVGTGKERTEIQETLFGPEMITRASLMERARISDFIRRELQSDKRLFQAAGEQKGAQRLGEAGNVIRAQENARIALQTAQAIELYDKLSATTGPVNDVLSRAADELAAGGNPDAVKQRAYAAIRDAIRTAVPGAADLGPRPGSAPGTPPGGAGRGGEVGPEVPIPLRAGTPGEPTQELFRVTHVPGRAIERGDTGLDVLAGARVQPTIVDGFPVVLANQQAMVVLKWVGDETYSPTHVGLTMPHSIATQRITGIEGLAENYPDYPDLRRNLQTMAAALRDNRTAAGDRPMIVVDASPANKIAEVEISLAEELAHVAQIEATGMNFADHVGGIFFDHPLAQRVAEVLRGQAYREYDDGGLSMEIGARLMEPGRYRELDLNEEEAVELAGYYCDVLESRHGPEAVAKVVQQVYHAFEDTGYDAHKTPERGGHPPSQDKLAPVPTGAPRTGPARNAEAMVEVERREGEARRGEPPTGSLFEPTEEESSRAAAGSYEAQLEGERLTAQFKAAVTREEQLRKLKRLKPKQYTIFGEEPFEQQGSLFSVSRLPPVPTYPSERRL
jgi:hypothetical protein